jgi:hypothetical protein
VAVSPEIAQRVISPSEKIKPDSFMAKVPWPNRCLVRLEILEGQPNRVTQPNGIMVG